MADQLKNTLSFVDLAPGATVVLPHGLNVQNGRPVEPDIIFIPSADLVVTADTLSITLTNQGGDSLSGDILVEFWHSIERAFGGVQNEDLPVKPYIVVSVEGGNQPPQPPFPISPTLRIIYARATGSDLTGNGRTIATAYRTFVRAVRDLPRLPSPNELWRIDITDLGSETLPPSYEMPVWEAPYGGDFTNTFGAINNAPFNTMLSLEIYAAPRLVPSLGADATINVGDLVGPGITVDNDTGLCEIHTSKSYPVDSLKGKLIETTTVAGVRVCGPVWHNTNVAPGEDVIYVAHGFVPDGPPPAICGIFCLPSPPCFITEQSATLITQRGLTDVARGQFIIGGSGSIGFRGVKFQKANPAEITSPGIRIWRSATTFWEGCDMDSFSVVQSGGCNFVLSSNIHDGNLFLQGPVGFYNTYLHDIPSMDTPISTGVCCLQMIGFVVENCAAIGSRYDPIFPSCRGTCTCFDARYGVIRGAQIDTLWARIADPSNPFPGFGVINPLNQIPGYGVLVRGGCVCMDHIKIFACDADAIFAEICPGCSEIKSITGGEGGLVFTDLPNTANGTGSGSGFGVNLNDGAHFYVQDNFPGIAPTPPAAGIVASSVTGVSGDLSVGTLGAQTWGGLAGAVNKTFYDITAVGVGGATGTGSYIVQKP